MDRSDGAHARAWRWVRDPATLWRRVDASHVVLLAPTAAEPAALQGPGAALWDLLGDLRTHDELVAALAAAYGAPAATVSRDIVPLLEELLAQGALRRVA